MMRSSQSPSNQPIATAQELDPVQAGFAYAALNSKLRKRLAADKMGGELVMMLFLGAFSAILTKFFIESNKLLQPDRTDISNRLLQQILQSLQSLEQRRPLPAVEPIQLATFLSPWSAHWITTLWLSSITLSLSAGLIAMFAILDMLAKGWPMTYNTMRPRSARNYALLHQSRFNALLKWRALLLPRMLLLAWLLFVIGLVLHFVTLDKVLAAVVVVIIGGTFYAAAAFLGVERLLAGGLEEVQR